MQPNPPITPRPDLSAIRPEPVPDTNAAATVNANRENDFFTQDKKKKEHEREQRIKQVLNYVIVLIIVVTGFLLVMAIGVRVVHLILPEDRTWLSEKQINILDNLAKYAGSGALGVTLTKYLSKNISDTP